MAYQSSLLNGEGSSARPHVAQLLSHPPYHVRVYCTELCLLAASKGGALEGVKAIMWHKAKGGIGGLQLGKLSPNAGGEHNVAGVASIPHRWLGLP